MIKIGMTIADRYEILEKIGTGGMSDVYRGKDHKLNRFVAVKVLKQEFSENTEFVRKFRTEAQAAAGLMHPNIVNVYDVGEENKSYYIVMELVEGITLKKYIEKKARLAVKEAVSIGIQVGMGIEAAHANHIIHRDIKPQNIIISKEGKVKVTDFGIAKAATSNTITSNVMGSVHYTSPEQVRGGFSDEKSDIYSLGITLFEMLTGRVPFNGETTVAVAIKHIQEEMPSPREFVPEIPISVEQIVLKCTQKSPDRRYQSAPELIEDLKRSLISPDEDFVKLDNVDVIGATKNITEQEIQKIRLQTEARDIFDAQTRNTGQIREKQERGADIPEDEFEGEYDGDYPPYDDGGYDDGYYEEDERGGLITEMEPVRKKKSSSGHSSSASSTHKSNSHKAQSSGKSGNGNRSGKPQSSSAAANRKKKKKKKNNGYENGVELITTILIMFAAIAVGAVFLYIVGSAVGIFGNKPQENKPVVTIEDSTTKQTAADVVGMDMAAAQSTLEGQGFTVMAEYQASATVTEGKVISMNPSAGTELESGAAIRIQISSGSMGAQVPDVTGKTRPEAVATLEAEGFHVEVLRENSDTVDRDMVISQDPQVDSRIARGATVYVTVSLGKETTQVAVPDLLGRTEQEARSILEQNELNYKMVGEEYNDTYESGTVCYQSYSAGITVGSGTEVEYRVSKGAETAYYNVNYVVNAPADYAGGDATVQLVASDNTAIYGPTMTSSFPVTINITGLQNISSGLLTITYLVNEQQAVEDATGTVTMQTVQVVKTSDPVTVTFTKAE